MISYPIPKVLKSEFVKAIQECNKVSYLNVAKALLNATDYLPYSTELNEANDLLERDLIINAKEVLKQGLTLNLLLSPSAHMTMAYINKLLDDERNQILEIEISQALLTCILSTGKGSKLAPYRVTRTTDEYDVLRHKELVMSKQELLSKNFKHFDILHCHDGSQLYFDITDIFCVQEKLF